jgi:adenine-specific DNA-methyltransferase
MNYIGSKIKLLPFIDESIKKVIGDDDCNVFCDLFAGTGSVGAHFKKQGYKIIANDLQYYSYVLNKQIIGNHLEFEFNGLIEVVPKLENSLIENRKHIVCDYLNTIRKKEGFIFTNYSPNKNSERMYLTSDNAKKCDAIRTRIEYWKQRNLINDNEYYFLISSLIKTVDNLANVLSVYGAYLKHFKKRALKTLELKPYDLIINDKEHQIYNEDANLLIKDIETDILYIDPPYNERQYATNYHLLETIAKYDKPVIYGKTGLRPYQHQKSKYCSIESAKKTFIELIKNAKAKYIFVSYNNEGIISKDDLKNILESKGQYGCFEQKYTRYKSDSKRDYKAKYTIEYLHYCKCNF